MHLALEIAAVPVALLIIGIVYQSLGSRRDRLRFTDGGRWVRISNGASLFLLERGHGAPTVIFESGIGATNLNWRHIQETVAEFTATAAYDRCGLGWSSDCRTPRTPSNIAIELHEMLQHAQVKAPYILVGHSFGGLVMRRFALLFPEEVSGVVLVDPMRCSEWPPLNPGKQSEIQRGRALIRCGVYFAASGFSRLALTSLFRNSHKHPRTTATIAAEEPTRKTIGHVVHRLRSEVGKMAPSVRPVVAAHWSRPAFYAGMRKHIDAIPDTVREMHGADPILDIPVIVFTPGKSEPLNDDEVRAIGNCAQQVIAPASAHWVHLDQPELVIEAVRAMYVEMTPETATVAG
jgi:pimeloyl-ACP methyl ester carboxylesterase